MHRKAEKFLQIAPHSLAIVLSPGAALEAEEGREDREREPPGDEAPQLGRHHIGYEIFADFKQENMQHFWNPRVTAAVAETFFLGWLDEQVLLIQGKEEHLEVLREGWTRRSLKPPAGFRIKCLEQVCRTWFLESCYSSVPLSYSQVQ
ncbi:storkhead-box protein 1-like [Gopherus flavomarginatus]|uniref:storkhead-box protein 1-like n=1 Tax=Gopherus flavomarginatus TaxID=286002 RepID=UPI0021CBB3EA|nr:storkhead-box protein 1-like [Gopherus flavomarginatus]